MDLLTDFPEFWDAARDRRLVRPVCAECGASFFVPQEVCPHCRSGLWAFQESQGRGTVATATTVHRPPTADREAPYTIAVIDLDEGWSMLANLTGDLGDLGSSALIGARVIVDWSGSQPAFQLTHEEGDLR